MVFEPADDEFYGIDPVTGVGTLLFTPSEPWHTEEITSNGSELLLATGSQVYSLDLTTGTRAPYQRLSTPVRSGLKYVAAEDGAHRISVGVGEVVTDIDFGNRQATGAIQGRKFEDVNGDGVQNVNADVVLLRVRLTPRGGRDQTDCVVDLDGTSVLKVRVAAAPVDRAANASLVRPIASTFGVAPTGVRLRAGATSRLKTAEFCGDTGALICRTCELAS